MANPFLVLGGIAISVITAAFGVLAVPGWVNAAQDASAINDLTNIRAAQEAAVTNLGAYTSDIQALRSGQLGVKAEPADGVTFLGLDAKGNETWCAAVRSQSGRYFAASNFTTAVASAATAGGAVADAQCGPGATAALTAAPLGPVVQLNAPWQAAWTPQGVYTVYGWGPAQIARSGPDGRAHAVNPTGPITEAMYLDTTGGFSADPAGNLYLMGIADDGAGGANAAVYRVAPDESSARVWMGTGPSTGTEKLTVGADGILYIIGGSGRQVWKVANPGSATPSAPVLVGTLPVGWTDSTSATADGLGNVYVGNGATGSVLRMNTAGVVTTVNIRDSGGAPRELTLFSATADGTALYGIDEWDIYRVNTANGRYELVAMVDSLGWPELLRPHVVSVDPSGNLYFADRSDAQAVFRLTAGGQLGAVMTN